MERSSLFAGEGGSPARNVASHTLPRWGCKQLRPEVTGPQLSGGGDNWGRRRKVWGKVTMRVRARWDQGAAPCDDDDDARYVTSLQLQNGGDVGSLSRESSPVILGMMTQIRNYIA